MPPVPVRQWVISVPKRLRGMLADRPRAVAALTKIFLAEIERLLLAASGGTPDAETPRTSRPRLGGISFLHRFGSALNHHVHLHACVTDGPSRSRKSTRPGANGVVDLSPFEFLDRLADLVPPSRKHRHRYHGVLAPNHKLRRAVTSLAKRERRKAPRGGDRRAWGRRSRRGRLGRGRLPNDGSRQLASRSSAEKRLPKCH